MFAFVFGLLLSFQTLASVPARPSSAPLRFIFLGGYWSAGSWAKFEEAVPARFQRHLEQYLGRKIEIRSALVNNPAELPQQMKAMLREKPADFVFFFCDHSGVPIYLASQSLTLWKSEEPTLGGLLNREIGAIRLGSKMRKSPLPEDILLNPFSEIMTIARREASVSGTKFVLLWPGFPITPGSWEMPTPNTFPESLISVLDYFKPKPRVSSERMLLHFRRREIPIVTNLQISRYFSAIREADKENSTETIFSAKTADDVGKMLAASVLSSEF